MMARKEAWPSGLSCCGGAAGCVEVCDCERALAFEPVLQPYSRVNATRGSVNNRPPETRRGFNGFLPIRWQCTTAVHPSVELETREMPRRITECARSWWSSRSLPRVQIACRAADFTSSEADMYQGSWERTHASFQARRSKNFRSLWLSGNRGRCLQFSAIIQHGVPFSETKPAQRATTRWIAPISSSGTRRLFWRRVRTPTGEYRTSEPFPDCRDPASDAPIPRLAAHRSAGNDRWIRTQLHRDRRSGSRCTRSGFRNSAR